MIEYEKILRLGDKDNLLSKILRLEKELKSINENINAHEKNLKDIKCSVNDNKLKLVNMEFNVRRNDSNNLCYNENDINDWKKKIKIVKEDVEDNNINKFKENLEERLD